MNIIHAVRTGSRSILLATFCCIGVGFSSPAIAQKTSEHVLTLSLEECINRGLQQNFNLKSLQLGKESSAEILAQSKRDLLPSVSANASQQFGYDHSDKGGNTNAGSYQLQAQMSLFDGARNWNTIRQNKVLVDQSQQKLVQAQNQLTINIIQAYLSALKSEELLNYRQKVTQTSEAQYLQGESRYKSGNLLESDYLLLRSQWETDKFNVVNTQISRNNAVLNLKEFLSLAVEDSLSIRVPLKEADPNATRLPPLKEVIAQTLAWFPDMKLAQSNMEIATYDTKIAKGGYAPSLNLSGGVGTAYTSGFGSWSTQVSKGVSEQIGLSLSIPLWNKGQTRSNVRQSEIREKQSQLSAQQTELSLRRNLEQAYLTVSGNEQQYLAAAQRHQAYKASFEAYEAMFKAGSITVVDLLQQQNSYLSALNDYLQAKYDYLLNRKVIDVYMGYNITF